MNSTIKFVEKEQKYLLIPSMYDGAEFWFADEDFTVSEHTNTVTSYSGISRAGSSTEKIQMDKKIFKEGDYIPPYYWYWAKNHKYTAIKIPRNKTCVVGYAKDDETNKQMEFIYNKLQEYYKNN